MSAALRPALSCVLAAPGLLRISAQLYNSLPQYRALAEALRRCLGMADH